MQMELSTAIPWDLPLTLDVIKPSMPSRIEHTMSTDILLGKVHLVPMGLSSDNKRALVIMSITKHTVIAHIHIKVHIMLLSILPVGTAPSWRIAPDLELTSTVPWDLPMSDPEVLVNPSLVDNCMLTDILLMEGKAGIAPVDSPGNVEGTHGVASVAPNVAGVVDLEVPEPHIVLDTVLLVPAGPGNLPAVVPCGSPVSPIVPVGLFDFDDDFGLATEMVEVAMAPVVVMVLSILPALVVGLPPLIILDLDLVGRIGVDFDFDCEIMVAPGLPHCKKS